MSLPAFTTIYTNTIALCFDLSINDIPLYAERTGKPIAADIPINHLLLNGPNKVTVTIRPAKNAEAYPDHAKSSFEVCKRNMDEKPADRKQLAKLSFPDYLKNDKLRSSALEGAAAFDNVLEYDVPLWQKSKPLLLSEELNKQVYQVYKSFYSGLKTKSKAAIAELNAIKNVTYENCYGKTRGRHQEEMNVLLDEVFNDSNYTLIDFAVQHLTPKLAFNGRLVMLQNQDNRSPLQFYNKKTKVTRSFPIFIGNTDKGMAILL